MEFLRVLEGIRTPALSAILGAVTYLGDQTVFMLFAIVFFWCVSKRRAYYIFAVGLTGMLLNQWLKLLCRVPRPWELDPTFTIVESARAAAEGYSFPSGHTQNVVGTLGCLVATDRRTWLRAVCAALMLLVPFSRMYLGVHTPLDVGAAAAAALALVFAYRPCFSGEERFRAALLPVLAGLLALSAAYLLYAVRAVPPTAADEANFANGVRNAWTLLGCVLGLLAAYLADRRRPFREQAPLPGQICKVVLGVALLLGIRVGAKALLGAAPQANAARYFLMVAFAGGVWPRTFPYFARLGAKKDAEESAGTAR